MGRGGAPAYNRGMITERAGRAARRAEGDAGRIHHELKQCLRATGVDPAFSAWPPQLLTALWDALRPNAETRAFEESADRLRAEAVGAADRLDRLSALSRAGLGESQAYQAERALLLRHYLDSKLLLWTAAAERLLEARALGPERAPESVELIERGAPARMPMLELVDERASEPGLQRTFKDVRRALGGACVPPVYRALALWPRYLESAWERLKPLTRGEPRARAARALTELSRKLAGTLPLPAALELDAAAPGQDPQEALAAAREALGALAGQAVDTALLALDWQAPEILRRSPFPARARARGA